MRTPAPKAPAASLQNGDRRFRRTGPLILALVVQLALLAITVFVVVVVPGDRSEPEFTATPTVYLPQRELEHRIAVAEFQQASSSPPLVERLSSSALMPEGLPPMPDVSTSDFNPMDASAMTPPDADAMLGESGLMGANSATNQSAASFFGIEDSGERIVIVANTSVSVVKKAANRGVAIERIQEEMIDLVEGLESTTLFGIVQFSQGVRAFEDFLAPATTANKRALREWVPANLRGNPRARPDQDYYGHEAAFEKAFALEPDVIFLLTDGKLNRREGTSGNYSYPEISYAEFQRSVRSFQGAVGQEVRIHVIGFEMEASDLTGMRRFTREFDGELREM